MDQSRCVVVANRPKAAGRMGISSSNTLGLTVIVLLDTGARVVLALLSQRCESLTAFTKVMGWR